MSRGVAPLIVVLGALGLLAAGEAGSTRPREKSVRTAAKPPPDQAPQGNRAYTTETLRGRVVWIEDALARGFAVTTDPAAAETTVVLESADGRLVPIIPDVRGRSFAVDSRLRDVELELLVRRWADAPLVQVIRVFRPKDQWLYEIDYWCDICAIPMFTLKACECCQGPTRLRERLVEDRFDGG
jgi:hypothetical protein